MSLVGSLDGHLTGGVLVMSVLHKNQWLSLLFLLDGYLTGSVLARYEECCRATG
jgi:hypothetical protein